MKKVINRGFTLIELLVVIAIIGILASIVLVSLNSARNKGKDTRVISDVNQLRTQLESDLTSGLYTDLYGGSAGANIAGATTTAASSNIGTLIADANTNGPSSPAITFRVTSTSAGTNAASNVTGYAIYGALNSGQYFCVDYTGNNATLSGIPTAGSGATACHYP